MDRFAGALGSGIFGFINRLLIPLTGLHQVLNTIARFQIGDPPMPQALGPRRHQPLLCYDGTAGDVYVRLLPDHDVYCRAPPMMYFAAPKERVVRWWVVCRCLSRSPRF